MADIDAPKRAEHISDNGVKFIAEFEGFSANWYDDGVGVQTIGYGHTGELPDGFSAPLSESEGLALLKQDLTTYEDAVKAHVTAALNENQFAAIVSFVYNGGAGWLTDDYDLADHLNSGDFKYVTDKMPEYSNPSNPNVHEGLLRRRRAEVALFWS